MPVITPAPYWRAPTAAPQPAAVPTAAAAAAPSASPLALQLPPRDYESAGGERCADGAHVVLIPVIPMGSIIMRGLMPLSVLNSTRPALHGARVSYLGWTGPRNLTLAQRLDRHFAQFGAPSACVLLKYADDDALSACRRRGALVLLDCIDNFRCFGVSRAAHEYPKYDALLVQTAAHQRWLAGKGVRSAVLPHPHGDHRRVRHAHPLRARLRGVGLVYGDPKNLPLRHELVAICRACAAVNATFYLVYSPSSSTLKAPQPYHCEGHGGVPPAPPPPPPWPSGGAGGGHDGWCRRQRRAPPPVPSCDAGASSSAEERAAYLGSLFAANLSDVSGQHRFYENDEKKGIDRLRAHVDVGLLWPPLGRKDPKLAIENRPPTRMHWWWAQSIPVVAFPMHSYVEAAARIGYPPGLVNLSTADQIAPALCSISSRAARGCLQRAVMRGADLASPLHAALELLTAVCAVADAVGRPLARSAAGEDQWMTRALIKG